MLIIGAKGLAKEILQLIEEQKEIENNISFFDDVNLSESDFLHNKFNVLRDENQVLNIFKKDPRFILGLGNPNHRLKLYHKFISLGGELVGFKSKNAYIGDYTEIEDSATIMSGVNISNGVSTGKALLAYYGVIITHDVKIGDFVELSPGCQLLGNVQIESQVQIGAGAIVLPKVKVGAGALIGAGAVVTKDVRDGAIVYGVPAR